MINLNERERRQFERESQWRAAYDRMNEINARLRQIGHDAATQVINDSWASGQTIKTVIMVDDHEIEELRITGQVTLLSPTLDGKVVVATLRRTGEHYSGIDGKQYK